MADADINLVRRWICLHIVALIRASGQLQENVCMQIRQSVQLIKQL